jgi:membrane associated rhomboid family serine protease
MFIPCVPWSSDAPTYHRPIVTIVLVVANTAVYVWASLSKAWKLSNLWKMPEGYDQWLLALGSDVEPLQWLTHSFFHAGLFHLAASMFFLWTFGMLVEGKLGWWRFSLLYVFLAVANSAILQAIAQGGMLSMYSFGTTSIVMSLAAMTLIWAPKNDVHCFFVLGIRANEYDAPVGLFAGAFVFIEVAWIWLIDELTFGPARLQFPTVALDMGIAAVVGLLLGVLMLKAGWVRCEDWDVFSILAGKEGDVDLEKMRAYDDPEHLIAVKTKSPEEVWGTDGDEDQPDELEEDNEEDDYDYEVANEPDADAPSDEEARAAAAQREANFAAALAHLQEHMDRDDPDAAYALYKQICESLGDWDLPEADLARLIKQLERHKHQRRNIPLLMNYIERFPDRADVMRLRLAIGLIKYQQRPRHALELLEQIDDAHLTDSLRETRRRIERQAQQMIEDRR